MMRRKSHPLKKKYLGDNIIDDVDEIIRGDKPNIVDNVEGVINSGEEGDTDEG